MSCGRRDEEKAAKVRSIGTGVRRASPEDERAISGLLDLNGVPRRPAAEEGFLVAGPGGEVLAALEYRVLDGRLLLGPLVAAPWAGEHGLVGALQAEAHALAREMGLRGVEAMPASRGDSSRDAAGHDRRGSGWRPSATDPPGLRGELPEGGWRRVLALLGMETVPFFRAFPR